VVSALKEMLRINAHNINKYRLFKNINAMLSCFKLHLEKINAVEM